MVSELLRTAGSFREAIANTCPISERWVVTNPFRNPSLSSNSRNSAAVVEKVCEYMSFKAYYDGPGSKEGVDVNEFTERIPPEVALELCVTLLPIPL
jgi:transcription elongation factor B subunit 1